MKQNKKKSMPAIFIWLFGFSFIPYLYVLAIIFEPSHIADHRYTTYILDPSLQLIARIFLNNGGEPVQGWDSFFCFIILFFIVGIVVLVCFIYQVSFIISAIVVKCSENSEISRQEGGGRYENKAPLSI